jgi:hypothetical protein
MRRSRDVFAFQDRCCRLIHIDESEARAMAEMRGQSTVCKRDRDPHKLVLLIHFVFRPYTLLPFYKASCCQMRWISSAEGAPVSTTARSSIWARVTERS